jgi:CubicO group peptidase (beta-lactamase class C family)
MSCAIVTRCRVPAEVQAVTTAAAESDPRDVGVAPAAVARIWTAVERLYRSGMHPAIALCVRRGGQVILDRTIGHARGNGPDDPPGTPNALATPATPFGLFSATKAITAMVVHLLDERNLLRLDDPLAEYLPAFSSRGKRWITIRHVLTHRAGLPSPPAEAMNLDLIGTPERVVDMICASPLEWRPGRQLAYHAVTGGFILGEVIRRVTGRTIREVHDEAVRRPLGLRWLRYGIEPHEVPEVAVNYFTGWPALPPISTLLRRALGVEFVDAARLANDPRFLCGIVPAASMVATANEVSRYYQLLLQGGELDGVRVFDRRTIARATAEQSYLEFDFTLGLPLRYGMGFMLGGRWLSFYGPDTPHAFGHLGLSNVVSWADPERGVAAALLTSGKPLFYPELIHAFDVLRQIGIACPKLPRTERQAWSERDRVISDAAEAP